MCGVSFSIGGGEGGIARGSVRLKVRAFIEAYDRVGFLILRQQAFSGRGICAVLCFPEIQVLRALTIAFQVL